MGAEFISGGERFFVCRFRFGVIFFVRVSFWFKDNEVRCFGECVGFCYRVWVGLNMDVRGGGFSGVRG